MKHTQIGHLMVTDVVTAQYTTPFKDVIRLLREHHIGGLPVLDDDDRVIGFVSAMDPILQQDAFAAESRTVRALLSWFFGWVRERAGNAHDPDAGVLMSAPPITVRADTTVAQAGRTMAQRHVKRLPVVDDEERLVGIVTPRELLLMFFRPDQEIKLVLTDIIVALQQDRQTVSVDVEDGVVTLKGQLQRRSEKKALLHMVCQTDGVVAVVDKLA